MMQTRATSFALVVLLAVLPACEPSAGPEPPRRAGDTSEPSLIAFAIQEQQDLSPVIAVMPAQGGPVRRLRQGSDPAWSPDGRSLVFKCRSRICTMDADGSSVQRLTTPEESAIDEVPTWGANGLIAFTRNYMDGSPRDILVIPENGGDIQRLTKPRSDDFDPSWSPDGQSIAFIRVPGGTLESAPHDDPARANQVWTMAADGSNLRRVTTIEHGAGFPVWSPDRSTIAFGAAAAIWVVSVDGGDPNKLEPATTGEGIEGLGSFPTWSPDGARIAYTCSTGEFDDNDLCVMNADGTGRTTILDTPANEASPAWQPVPQRASQTEERVETPVPTENEEPFRLLVHCGLSIPLEFDDRLWLPVDPELRRTINPPEGFGTDENYDEGTIRVVDDDTLIYKSSEGVEVEYEPSEQGPAFCE